MCLESGRTNLRCWMVRCKLDVLEHSNNILQQNKKILGENSIVDYVSERLNHDPEIMRTILEKYPLVLKCGVPKIKKTLDYLLIEAKYEPHEIANVIRICTHSLSTTKKRFEELKKLGCRPSGLSIICLSQKGYSKFVTNWAYRKEKI